MVFLSAAADFPVSVRLRESQPLAKIRVRDKERKSILFASSLIGHNKKHTQTKQKEVLVES